MIVYKCNEFKIQVHCIWTCVCLCVWFKVMKKSWLFWSTLLTVWNSLLHALSVSIPLLKTSSITTTTMEDQVRIHTCIYTSSSICFFFLSFLILFFSWFLLDHGQSVNFPIFLSFYIIPEIFLIGKRENQKWGLF